VALPHTQVRLGEGERIFLRGESLFRGYYPDWREPGEFPTQDRGQLDADGHLRVLGRMDAVIITGGEKVDPAELEALLHETRQFPAVAVLGLPDARWGQRVVAVYPGNAHPNFHEVIRVSCCYRGNAGSWRRTGRSLRAQTDRCGPSIQSSRIV
jgi:O-succinylbenzoic acid--CoA ligase